MPCFSCESSFLGSRPGVFAALSRAAAKSAAAKLRSFRVVPMQRDWPARATICERCPKRVVSAGVSYCGTPFLRNVNRDSALDGCGCPTIAKAKDPQEHCPVNAYYLPARRADSSCNCKWCVAK